MRILYVGSMAENSNSFRRFSVLRKLGHDVQAIDTEAFVFGGNRWFGGLQHRLNIGPGISKLNRFFLETARRFQPELIWFDNRIHIQPASFRQLEKSILKLNLLVDDPFGAHPAGWQLYKKSIPFIDFHFVQRAENLVELMANGAYRVETCFRSFDPNLHRPLELTPDDLKKYGSPVGFIGSHAPHRAAVIAWLIENGIDVAVYGYNWINNSHWKTIKPLYRSEGLFHDDYVKAICGMDIALHFLRKENRDSQDSRTFEIPACGAFMLAERSPVHEQLFEENREAVFFDSKEELLEKLRFYTQNTAIRQQIAAAGRRRAIDSGYDHESRIRQILNTIQQA